MSSAAADISRVETDRQTVKPEFVPISVEGRAAELNGMASRAFHPGSEGFGTRPKASEDAAHAAHDYVKAEPSKRNTGRSR